MRDHLSIGTTMPTTLHIFWSEDCNCWCAMLDMKACPRLSWPRSLRAFPDTYSGSNIEQAVEPALLLWRQLQPKVVTQKWMQDHYKGTTCTGKDLP